MYNNYMKKEYYTKRIEDAITENEKNQLLISLLLLTIIEKMDKRGDTTDDEIRVDNKVVKVTKGRK